MDRTRNYTLFHWIVPEEAAGNLTVTAPAKVTAGNNYVVTGSWSGTAPRRASNTSAR